MNTYLPLFIFCAAKRHVRGRFHRHRVSHTENDRESEHTCRHARTKSVWIARHVAEKADNLGRGLQIGFALSYDCNARRTKSVILFSLTETVTPT